MSVKIIARRYAAALADVVLKQSNSRQIQQELQTWAEMMQANPELLEVFRNPTIQYADKRRVLDTLITKTRVSQTTANVLQVLLQNARLSDLREVNLAFARVLDERSGMVTAHITTAHPLSSPAQESLRKELMSLTKSGVNLEFAVDDAIICGIVTRIGSTIYDGSVRNKLEQAKEQMIGAGT